jgi:hypothetical protein
LDLWNNSVPSPNFPELFSFAKNQNVTLQKDKEMLNISDLLYLPISQVAQLLQLANLIQTFPRGDEYDIWTYIWGAPFFASMKAYKHLLGYRFVHPYYTWLQKSAAQKKHKVFFFFCSKTGSSLETFFITKTEFSHPMIMCFVLLLMKRQWSTNF